MSNRIDLPLATALRVACHETGHAIAAWFGPVQGGIDVRMPTDDSPNGRTEWGPSQDPAVRLSSWLRAFSRKRGNAEDLLDAWGYCAVMLGGIAGEGAGMRTVSTVGCENDLNRAMAAASNIAAVSGDGPHPWGADASEDTKIDLARMFVTPPAPAVAAVLNACYRRARFLIKREDRGFHAVVVTLLRDWHVDHRTLHSLLGPRP